MLSTLAPSTRLQPSVSLARRPAMLLADEAPTFKIIKGKRIPIGSNGVYAARDGECIEPIDPIAGVIALGAFSVLAYFGFNTEKNRADSIREGGNVPRRRALTWLALQTGAAFYVGPQLTNPCSNVNSDDRWSGRKKSPTL